jgi:hypothetical protein
MTIIMREIDIDHFKSLIERQGKNLPPDDDWLPFLFLVKDKKIALIGMPPANSQQEKVLTANILKIVIKRTNPDAVCYVSTAWVGEPLEANRFVDEKGFEEAFDKGWIPRPSEDPDRKEVVIMVVMNRFDESGISMGYIKRRKDRPPMIKRWKDQIAKGESIGGRFGEAITEGFASADKNGNLEVLNSLKGLKGVEAQDENGRTKTE